MMMLTSGTKLGPFEVAGPIGAGGMGEVYRARDSRLGREVALKLLPGIFLSDPERLARFEREAKTLAALNHPHIAQIYGIEERDGIRALVMELVEGEDRAQRLTRGAMALDEVLPLARQIASALEAAHEAGIVHRDPKPANIRLRPDGTVKVLDFGLAKAFEAPGSPGDAAAVLGSPTLTSPALITSHGVVLGTAAYMSPEQARGKPVDKRADIWAFGCVLFEAIAGRPAFAADTITDTLAAVVRADPDWSVLPPDLPPGLHRLLSRCLEKDPHKRLRDIGDGLLDLDDATFVGTGSAAPSKGPRTSGWLIAAAAVPAVLAGAIAGWTLKPAAAPQPRTAVRFALPLDAGFELTNTARRALALSPDGEALAYTANRQIYFRSVGGTDLRPGPEPANSHHSPFLFA